MYSTYNAFSYFVYKRLIQPYPSFFSSNWGCILLAMHLLVMSLFSGNLLKAEIDLVTCVQYSDGAWFFRW